MKHLSQFFIEKLNIQQPLLESGASGHMLHPQDVDDFTGVDIQELIQKVFGGELEGMTEKMDGFGIQASMNRKGEVVFIRNKTQLNSEKGGMTIDDFPRQWDSNPTALENYTKGARIIEAVFKKIGPDWFNPNETTRRVANCECILEGVTNTIPYASDQVDFHNIWIYEWNGTEWINTEVTKHGLDVIEKACEGIDKVQLTPQVIIKYSQETEKLKEKWLSAWQKFLKDYGFSEDMTIEAIKYSLFFKWAEKDAPWLVTDHKAAMDCCRRWLFGDRHSANLKDLKAIYQDHIDKFNKFEKSPSKVSNAVCFPLQKFFYGMGADVVKVTSGLVNDGRDDVVKSLVRDLQAATEKIKKEGSLEDNEFLQTWLNVLDEIGEENISSAEGVVFSYKGKMMKFTGGFVPLNRIIGYSKYTMKPKSLVESLFDDDLVQKNLWSVDKYKEIQSVFKKIRKRDNVFISDGVPYIVLYDGPDCIVYKSKKYSDINVISPKTISIGKEYLDKHGKIEYDTRFKFFQISNDYTFTYSKLIDKWYLVGAIGPVSNISCPTDISKEAKKIIDDFINEKS